MKLMGRMYRCLPRLKRRPSSREARSSNVSASPAHGLEDAQEVLAEDALDLPVRVPSPDQAAKTMSRCKRSYPRLNALHDKIMTNANVDAYLASERRIPFNEDGVFRCYPELEQ